MIDVEESWQAFAAAGYGVTVDELWVEKLADDLHRYRRIIDQTRPQVIVETGTRRGGSSAWFASLGPDVITVDIETHRVDPRVDAVAGVTYVRGDAADDKIADLVGGLVAGRRCMVSLDSDHHAPHVAAEIVRYSRLVSRGCYLVVEDGIADLLDADRARHIGRRIPEEGGPLTAVLSRPLHFGFVERDYVVEGLTPLTHHPAGWWRRRG